MADPAAAAPPLAPVVFTPRPEDAAGTRVARLMAQVGAKDPRALHAWSVADVERFWRVALDDLGVTWTKPYERVLDLSRGLPWARWFVGGRTNIVTNCLDRHVAG